MNKTVYKHASVFVTKPNNWVGLTVVNVRAVKNAVQLHKRTLSKIILHLDTLIKTVISSSWQPLLKW